MTLRIEADRITCDNNAHTASRIHTATSPERWRVSWLPQRQLTRNQAITAMTLAESLTGSADRHPAHPALIAAWATELDLTPTAVTAYLPEHNSITDHRHSKSTLVPGIQKSAPERDNIPGDSAA